VEVFPCRARTRLVLVSLSFHCGEGPSVEGTAGMHSCWALARVVLGADGRHSGLCEAVSPHVLQRETERPLRRTCTHEDERTAGPAGGEGSRATAWEAGYLSATKCLGYCCCCSGCEGHRGAQGTHRRLGEVGYLFAALVRGGCVTSVTDLTGHWQHDARGEGYVDQ
jgi:hypothetical protein